MFNYFFKYLALSLALVACSTSGTQPPVDWSYGTGTNIDATNHTRTEFYREGKLIYADGGSSSGAGAPYDYIINKNYYWAGGGGLPTEGVPVPDQALIEMVSFYDHKRYRIQVDLPKNLTQQMQQRYQVEGEVDQRNWLYFGLAPGGYYEVVLMGFEVSPDLLLARGIATEVTDYWYDKEVSVSEQYGIDRFDKKYHELFEKHPIPRGMAWAPIMDAYRANQPITDQHPVH